MRMITVTSALALTATVCLADATIEQKTQFHLSGAVGAVVNVFSRTAREGATSTTVIRGDRKLTRTGDGGEIVDLREEKVYMIDFGRRTYSVKTFDDLRREYEQAQERAQKREERRQEKAEKNNGPEYEVDFDVKSTGNKEEINGFKTHEEIVTVTVHEKNKPIEKSGGWILTSDMWIGPRVSALHEIAEFDRRFSQKVYGSIMPDARQIAMAMAATPAFAKAMKVFSTKSGELSGTAIRTNMKFDTVAGTDPSTQQQQDSGSSSPMGGLLNKMRQRHEEQNAGNRTTMLDSTTEILKASSTASAEDVAIPAGFRQR